eukprot:1204126-Prymnesium_polylepis.1
MVHIFGCSSAARSCLRASGVHASFTCTVPWCDLVMAASCRCAPTHPYCPRQPYYPCWPLPWPWLILMI